MLGLALLFAQTAFAGVDVVVVVGAPAPPPPQVVIVVPRSRAASLTSINFPPSTKTFEASTADSCFVKSSTLATDAIEASASPRNPSVAIAARSSRHRIFDVAWRSNANIASSRPIP